ncbi:MAG: T9SS type B sorting domain-containing protein [Bacteroidota bacterium]
MQKNTPLVLLFLIGLSLQNIRGQLGFCGGNSGDPIFTETFGMGLQDGPPLPAGTTTYNYVAGGPQQPIDGNYTISSRTNYFDWFDTTDHTPGDTNGKAFIVNADFTPGEFFRRNIDGLCENTSYEFSSWLLNLLPSSTECPNGGIPINVRFQIWDDTDTILLASGDTGDIQGTSSPIWRQYGLVFKTEPGQTSVILKMLNNGAGGCGNDLAIDDIVFRSCGDFINVTDAQNESITAICEDLGPTSFTLTANPDFTVFNSHFYQWQESSDGVDWVDIPGATMETYTTPSRNITFFYRVKVAEDLLNVPNSFCNVISDIFQVVYVPIPEAPLSDGPVAICANTEGFVSVEVPENISVNWYDSPSGGNLLLENSTVFTPERSGTYYAEASSTLTSCFSISRTAIEVTIFEAPEVMDENITFCETTSIQLSANVANVSYLWNTGETTETISVQAPGTYTVTVTNAQSCSNTKTIVVNQIDAPIIASIRSDAENIEVTMANSGTFEYSLNGISYGNSPIFDLMEGGLYTIYVRSDMTCPPVSQEFLHLVIPKFFTPNGDGFNDTFKPQGAAFSTTYEIAIFNRLGNLIVSSNNSEFSWDGSNDGTLLPSSDYWYSIRLDDTVIKGHFTLKR